MGSLSGPMRRSLRFRVWCSIVVVVLVALSVTAVFTLSRDRKSNARPEVMKRDTFWDKYQKIQVDMTQADVEAILGPPADQVVSGLFGPLDTGWVENGQRINVVYAWNSSG